MWQKPLAGSDPSLLEPRVSQLETSTTDARASSTKGKTFIVLKDRLEEIEQYDLDHGLNVKRFLASGSVQTTTGNMTSGTTTLTLAAPIDFVNGQGIAVKGRTEVVSLQITSAATASGNVTVNLDGTTGWGVQHNIAVLLGDTVNQVATKIAAEDYLGFWTAVAVGDTVTFTATNTGVRIDTTYSAGTTGATGTVTITTQGTNSLITSIVSGAGTTTLTLAAPAAINFVNLPVVHDDTVALQSTFDYASANGIRKVVLGKGKQYMVTNIFNIPSEIEVEGNGAKLLFENLNNIVINTQVGIRNSWNGILNIQGTNTGGTANIISYNSMLNKSSSSLYLAKQNSYLGQWGVSDSSIFAAGDFVMIQITFKPNSINSIIPMVEVLARIEYVESGYIYTDYYSPYDWSSYTFLSTDLIKKCDVKKNIFIHDISLKDLSGGTNRPPFSVGVADGANRQYRPCGIGEGYAFNIKVENITCEELKFSGVTQYFTHSCRTTNLDMIDAKYWGGGEGYATQNMNVMNLVVENVRSKGEPRHLVDISSGYFCKVRDCIGASVYASTFGLHGEGDHDIEYDNCVGGMTFGNGLANFPELGHNVTIRKSRITLNGIGYYTNTIFEDSDVMIVSGTMTDKDGVSYPTHYSPQMTFKDCTIKLTVNSNINCKKRGQNVHAYVIMENCHILYDVNEILTTNIAFGITGYDRVVMRECDVTKMQGYGLVVIRDCIKVTVDNNLIEDSVIFVDAPGLSGTFIDHTISDNKYTYTDFYNDKLLPLYAFITRPQNYAGCKGVIRIRDNTVESKQTTSPQKLYFMNLQATDNAGADLDIFTSGNVLKTVVADAIGMKFDLTNPSCRYSSLGNVMQGTITVGVNDALIDGVYKKSVLNRFAQRVKFNGTGASAGYAKVGSFNILAAGHSQFIFDWLCAAGINTSSGRIVGMVNISTMGTTPTAPNVLISNTKFGATSDVTGASFILVETAKSGTSHTYEIYVSMQTFRSFIFTPVFLDNNLTVSWAINSTAPVASLPVGTQFTGSDANV